MKVKEVKPWELDGYRNPTDIEKQQIQVLLLPKLMKLQKYVKFDYLYFFLFFLLMLSCCIGIWADGGFPDVKSAVFNVTMFLLLLLILICIHKSNLTTKQFFENITTGNYQVLDCIPYQYYYNQEEGRTEGSVKVQTISGKVCCVNYVVDIDTALLVERGGGKDLQMLLLYDAQTKESRVFSPNMFSKVSS